MHSANQAFSIVKHAIELVVTSLQLAVKDCDEK